MQLYALDQESRPIFANHALKQTNYFCYECGGPVRLRGGTHRQNHFYHLTTDQVCFSSGKSMTHLQIQLYLQKKLPPGDCQLECRFPTINRIADVVWQSRNIIFEVQCSSITGQEVEQRNQDYGKLGYQVVWILHDRRYNQRRMTAAEEFLIRSTHYFTNINAQGEGIIYDQFSLVQPGIRTQRLAPLPICLSLIEKKSISQLKLVKQRQLFWKLTFEDDLMNLAPDHPYYLEALEMEKSVAKDRPTISFFEKWILRPYRSLFLLFLEKACR